VEGQLLAHHPGLDPLRHHVRRTRRQAELPQVVVGRLLHGQHSPHQPAELDGVGDMGRDDRLGRARPHHTGELERALLVAPPVAAMLQDEVEPEPLPTAKRGNADERRKRVDFQRGEGPGAHDFLHRIGHRHDAEIQLDGRERCDARGELVNELDRLIRVCANQRLPRARIRDADGEVQAGRDPAEGHLTGDTHRSFARSNIQSRC